MIIQSETSKVCKPGENKIYSEITECYCTKHCCYKTLCYGTMNGELEWKQAAITYFTMVSINLSEGDEENYKNPVRIYD